VTTTVGVIGLGDIGRGVAANFEKAGFGLAVCDVRAEATRDFGDRATVSPNPRELAAASDVIAVAVLNDAQVESVLTGPEGVLAGVRPSATVLVLSTISVGMVRTLAKRTSEAGAELVDCGVSGGPVAAAEGTLVAMLGGTQEAVERIRPVVGAFSSLIIHMGPAGAGLQAKLARNIVQYGSWLAAYEGQRLAEAAGIDLSKLALAVRESDALIGGASRLMFRETVEPFGPEAHEGLVGAQGSRRGPGTCGRPRLGHADDGAHRAALRRRLRARGRLSGQATVAHFAESRRWAARISTDSNRKPRVFLSGRLVNARRQWPTNRRIGRPGDARAAGGEGARGGSETSRRQSRCGPHQTAKGRGKLTEDGAEGVRSRGLQKMEEVYQFSVDPDRVPGDFAAITVDHLFGSVWTRPGLDVSARRLLTIGVLAALGQKGLLEIQFRSALARGELEVEQIREVVIHLTHYIGWPLGSAVNEVAERVIASAGNPVAADPKAKK